MIYYCKQTNEKGLRGCTPPHLNLHLTQHSTLLCLGQSFSEFQSGFVSKSTFHYQHQVHSSGLACFTTIYTATAISGSNQFLQNPAKQLACSLPQQQPSRLPGAQGASQPVTMSPGSQHPKGSLNNQRLRPARHQLKLQHPGWLQSSLTHCQHLIIQPCKSSFPPSKQACTCL